MSCGGQDQRPGKFDGWVRAIPGVNHCDPMLVRGGYIDRRVYGSRRGNELEIGRRSMTLRGSGVRSRIAQTTSNGRNLSTRADGSETWSLKTVISALFERTDQSAISKATCW